MKSSTAPHSHAAPTNGVHPQPRAGTQPYLSDSDLDRTSGSGEGAGEGSDSDVSSPDSFATPYPPGSPALAPLPSHSTQPPSLSTNAKSVFPTSASQSQFASILGPLPTDKLLRRSLRSFILAFGVKAGITLVLRLLRGRLRALRRLPSILLATTLRNKDALRIGSLFGLFTFLFHGTIKLLPLSPLSSALQPRAKAFVAGAIASLAILVESPDNRLMWCQQFTMRAMQASYNGLKHRDLFHFPLGDSLLFVVSCAQIMFAYTHYPTTLPKDFLSFMIKVARIPARTLAANAVITRGGELPVEEIASLAAIAGAKRGMDPASVAAIKGTNPVGLTMLPCHFLHPETGSCTVYCGMLSKHVFSLIFPVYFTLHAVPTLLLRSKSVIKDPLSFIKRVLFNTSRSGLFLVTYVSGFQSLVCLLRKSHAAGLVTRDHRANYFVFGLLNSLSILLEDKKRRSELGLYVAPKAAHSLWQIMTEHKGYLPRIPQLDVALFAAAMGTIMSFYAREPERLSPMILRVLPRFIR
ncbi:hypothetical protein BCR44DRAFT_149986 [Catenaria anguillulae PL171]|uniref:Transmembrane protein 135 N-terminal domain-containing protein n=1 Tax=Catenaria anguillulae PL171 TaxID=765915 RepID=A0A1Y2H5B1_9FUNG|nr:hypothetical protein BCR44DRAFT_149986 [Catenaria anguillulae PL171]